MTVGAVRVLDAPAAVKVSPKGNLDRTVKWREAAAKTGGTMRGGLFCCWYPVGLEVLNSFLDERYKVSVLGLL